MPLYEYQCETCHHQFEVRQKISDPVIDKCIQCGHAVRKLISASGIMFKGTGWYVTDYSNKMKDPSQAKQSESQAKQSESQAKDGAGSGSEKTPAKSESGSTPDTSSSSPTSPPSSPAPSNSGSSSDSTT